jgi:hypothetical protein
MTTAKDPFLILEVDVGAPVTTGDAGQGVRRPRWVRLEVFEVL